MSNPRDFASGISRANLDRLVTRTEDRQALGLPLAAGTVRVVPAPGVTTVSVNREPPAASQRVPGVTTDEDRLNKTERRFLVILRARYPGTLVRIQAQQLKLAFDTRYLPDFSVYHDGRTIFYETKGGFIREDGMLKLRIAARLFPEYSFVLAQWKNSAWTETPVKP